MCSGVGLVLSCVFVLLCIFRDLSLSLLNIMKRGSPASFEKKKSSQRLLKSASGCIINLTLKSRFRPL